MDFRQGDGWDYKPRIGPVNIFLLARQKSKHLSFTDQCCQQSLLKICRQNEGFSTETYIFNHTLTLSQGSFSHPTSVPGSQSPGQADLEFRYGMDLSVILPEGRLTYE
jgi:hypothetical protein